MWLLRKNIEYPTSISLLNILRGPAHTLKLYLQFRESGHALFPMPTIKPQIGPCCGFYAINCALAYLYCKQPNLYKKSAPPARKRDVAAHTGLSLREIGKQLKVTEIGELYSVTDMSHIIDRAGFNSLIVDVNDYDYFLFIVRTAISLGIPIIIPFSSSNFKPLVPPVAEHAHWATIIGIMNNSEPSLLVAEHGFFHSAPAKDYFNSCHDMPDSIHERRYAKIDRRWTLQESLTYDANDNASGRVIPERNLNDYRRKLLLAVPPNSELSIRLP